MKIARSSYKKMRWQNGLGETAEIDRESSEGAYLWRLSQADIQGDCEFSQFPGFDRWLAIWQGDAIFLNDKRFSPQEPVRFSGDDKIACRLAGSPVRDVGLIFDRTKVDARMSVVEGAVHLPAEGVHYLFNLRSGETEKYEQAAEILVGRSFLISVWRRTRDSGL